MSFAPPSLTCMHPPTLTRPPLLLQPSSVDLPTDPDAEMAANDPSIAEALAKVDETYELVPDLVYDTSARDRFQASIVDDLAKALDIPTKHVVIEEISGTASRVVGPSEQEEAAAALADAHDGGIKRGGETGKALKEGAKKTSKPKEPPTPPPPPIDMPEWQPYPEKVR